MKPMTFEELKNVLRGHFASTDDMVECLCDKARIGMIPEDEAIRLPPEKEWPEWADCVTFHYGGCNVQFSKITTIPRSKPAWVPKVGEPVFTANHDYSRVNFGKVVSVYELDVEGNQLPKSVRIIDVIFPQGRGEYSLDHVKPGSITYIGKPWSEIPETSNGN